MYRQKACVSAAPWGAVYLVCIGVYSLSERVLITARGSLEDHAPAWPRFDPIMTPLEIVSIPGLVCHS